MPAARIPSLADIAASQGGDARRRPRSRTPPSPRRRGVALSPEDQRRAQEIARTIDFTKAGIESTYARDAQRSLSDFADNVLAHTSNKATGEGGASSCASFWPRSRAPSSRASRRSPSSARWWWASTSCAAPTRRSPRRWTRVVEKLERAQAQMVARHRHVRHHVRAQRRAVPRPQGLHRGRQGRPRPLPRRRAARARGRGGLLGRRHGRPGAQGLQGQARPLREAPRRPRPA